MTIEEHIRQLANDGQVSYTSHAFGQLLARGITTDTVETILKASDNQIVEIQSPSTTPGKEHVDPRYLVYSPGNADDVIVVSVLLESPEPEIRVITAEYLDDTVWDKKEGCIPAIVRK